MPCRLSAYVKDQEECRIVIDDCLRGEGWGKDSKMQRNGLLLL